MAINILDALEMLGILRKLLGIPMNSQSYFSRETKTKIIIIL